jgi:hypothetical protein
MGDPAETRYPWRSCLVTLVLIPIGVLIVAVLIYIAIDATCTGEADLWLVDYPDAELVSEQYDFVRPFGIGITTRVLHTPDAQSTVRVWYSNQQRETAREGHVPRRQLAIFQWTIGRVPDGDGSQITLYQQCADGLVLFPRQPQAGQ